MGVTILEGTTKYPLQKMGVMAGVCWNASTSDKERNIRRAKECVESGHGRVLEFVDVEMVLEGYSARVIREWYTHIAGAPTRLQQSTRYCEWEEGTAIVLPESVKKAIRENEQAYAEWCKSFIEWIDYLKCKGVPKEDVAMFYPLGMETKVVDKRNLRNLAEMAGKRLCARAYWEYRDLMGDVITELRKLSGEWGWVCDNLLVPQCEKLGFCPEKKSCGRKRGMNGT